MACPHFIKCGHVHRDAMLTAASFGPFRMQGMADRAIAENPKSVADYKAGKAAALQFLVGQVMRMSKGKANPQMVGELLKKKLG